MTRFAFAGISEPALGRDLARQFRDRFVVAAVPAEAAARGAQDRPLLRRRDDAESAAVVVRSALSLAATLELRGVEDEETLNRLRELGCRGGQGYFLGQPMTADKLERWLATRPRPNPEAGEAGAGVTAGAHA